MGAESESNDDACAVGLGCALEAFTEVEEVKGIIHCLFLSFTFLTSVSRLIVVFATKTIYFKFVGELAIAYSFSNQKFIIRCYTIY